MGRKGPRAKTKIVLKSVKQWEQLGNMHNLKFQTFLNKNHPNKHASSEVAVCAEGERQCPDFTCINYDPCSYRTCSYQEGIEVSCNIAR